MEFYNKSNVMYYQYTSTDTNSISTGWLCLKEINELLKKYRVEVFPLFFKQKESGFISYHNTLDEVLEEKICGIYIPDGLNLVGCGIDITQLTKNNNHYFINGREFLISQVWQPKKYQTKIDYKNDADEPYFSITISYIENYDGILYTKNHEVLDCIRAIDEETAKEYASLSLTKKPFTLKAKKIRFYSVVYNFFDDPEYKYLDTKKFFTFKEAKKFIKTLSRQNKITLLAGDITIYTT